MNFYFSIKLTLVNCIKIYVVIIHVFIFFRLLRNYTTIVGVRLYILASIKHWFLQKSNCSEEAPRSGERNVNIL